MPKKKTIKKKKTVLKKSLSKKKAIKKGAVKKISAYITRKVGDKLATLFKKNREEYEKKWNDIKIVIEYGMLTVQTNTLQSSMSGKLYRMQLILLTKFHFFSMGNLKYLFHY